MTEDWPASRDFGKDGRTINGSFEWILSVPEEETDLLESGYTAIPWLDFILNPRRLRGSDFLMRWSQGRWSEHRIRDAIDQTGRFFSLPYGPSSVAPEDPREFERYFDRLDNANPEASKRPDLLVFEARHRTVINDFLRKVGGEEELPFIGEDELEAILRHAILAIECENSLWIAKQMPDYGAKLRPLPRLGGREGLPKNAIVPTIIVKEEDRAPLKNWQEKHKVPIHIWHVFYDLAFGIALDKVDQLIAQGLVERQLQTFQAPSGPTTQKHVYKVIYHYAYQVGHSVEEPKIVPEMIVDKNGHVLPYVRFEGGRMVLDEQVIHLLEALAKGESNGEEKE